MSNVMSIQSCVFKRKENSEWENGILLNDGELIIDMDCKMVKAPIWNYIEKREELSILFKPEKCIVKGVKSKK